MQNRKAFTLIELLIVVLIIGILAAIAVPQYQLAVEKARMAEAITFVKAIANANQLFYLENGRYAAYNELDLLDVKIPGSTASNNSVKTTYFVYAPSTRNSTNYIANAKRYKDDINNYFYSIYVLNTHPDRISCYLGSPLASSIQQKLCTQLDKGTF